MRTKGTSTEVSAEAYMSMATRPTEEQGWIYPKRWRAGDKVAVIAPSGGCAAIFPHVRDLAVKRLEEEFNVQPVLLPTMKKLNNSLEERAADLMAAFADQSVKGIVCSIGGDDSIRMLKLLDTQVIRCNPKIVLGYSDITSIHLLLFQLKIGSFYGGNLLCQFGLSGPAMHQFTLDSFKEVLLTTSDTDNDDASQQPPSSQKTAEDKMIQWGASREKLDAYLEWGDPSNVEIVAPMTPNEGWVWAQTQADKNREKSPPPVVATAVRGRLWGGCLETLTGHLALRRYLPDELLQQPSTTDEDECREKLVLYLETSEVMAPSFFVYSFFQTLGEMGLLGQFAGVLMGRPKVKNHLGQVPPGGPDDFVAQQRAAVLRGLTEYGMDNLPVVFNVDFGHTDPQLLVPNGSIVEVDPTEKTIATIFRC